MSNNKQSSVDKDFVLYEEALALKELGFNEPCIGWWFVCNNKANLHLVENGEAEDNNNIEISEEDFPEYESMYKGSCSAPTFSQAFRWFDENTELMGFVVPSIKEGHFDWLIRIDWEEEIECDEAYSSRIEAELECLRKLIEIVKQGGNK